MKIFLISFLLVFEFNKEKCSESKGIILVLYFFDSFFIKFQPQIIDSLLAIKSFFVDLIILIVGFKPAIPEIADIVISELFNLI